MHCLKPVGRNPLDYIAFASLEWKIYFTMLTLTYVPYCLPQQSMLLKVSTMPMLSCYRLWPMPCGIDTDSITFTESLKQNIAVLRLLLSGLYPVKLCQPLQNHLQTQIQSPSSLCDHLPSCCIGAAQEILQFMFRISVITR